MTSKSVATVPVPDSVTGAAGPRLSTGSDQPRRDYLSCLRALLLLSQLMTETRREPQILQLAVTAVPSLASSSLHCVVLKDGTWVGPDEQRASVEEALEHFVGPGGPIELVDRTWSWAYPLRSPRGHLGHLVVGATTEPSEREQFLLRALAQQTGSAIGNARLHEQERMATADLVEVNERLRETVTALRRSMEIHERLTQVAVSGSGFEGLAKALHEVTGYPVGIEDEYGNLRAWAGPNRPDPYPKDPAARREQLLRRVLREGRPTRDGGGLVVVARPRPDLLGVIVLVDPAGTAGEQELMALEHGRTVLAMELARLRSLAETELRVRRDLMEDLLSGTEEESALRRAQALGYDLERPHRVVVVEGRGRVKDVEVFLHAVRRAARYEDVGSLLMSRGERVVVLADNEVDWESFRQAVLRELGGGRCRVGIGMRCEAIGELPRSHRQARLALDLQSSAEHDDQACRFEDLGVYRLFADLPEPEDIERFVLRWLEPLMQYDDRNDYELVETLSRYLECGGSYAETADALFIHRSTLKYRLQRIREIAGLNLNDPDTRFNLQLATRALDTLKILRSKRHLHASSGRKKGSRDR